MLDRKIAGWAGIALAPGIAMAAIGEGIGQIVSSSGATVNGTVVPNQGMIMPGNRLETGLDGRAIVDFAGGGQVSVLENSSVTFRYVSGSIHAQMSSGIVAARSLGRDPVIVETPGYRVEPTQTKAVYVVAILSDKTTVVTEHIGQVSVTQLVSGKRYVLDQGHYVELAASPGSGPAPSSPDQQSSNDSNNNETPPGILSSPTGRFIVAAGVGAGVGVGVLLGRTVLSPGPQSPSTP